MARHGTRRDRTLQARFACRSRPSGQVQDRVVTLPAVETVPCPHCEAPLKPAATFCLECDTPVVPDSGRLSVGEPTQVHVGRPILGISMIVAAVLVLGGAAYGTLAFVHHQRTTTQATKDVTRGTTLLLEAEGGRAGACGKTHRTFAGPVEVVRSECAQVVDGDPGVKVDKVVVDRLSLGAKTGTARVRATISDRSGTRTVERSVNLVKESKRWRLSWDGHPTV
jgi:hypothetical protein